MLVYLLTQKTAYLRPIRQIVESLKLPLVSCCSVNALLTSCSRGAGCVLIPATEYSIPDVNQVIYKLRSNGYPHAVLIFDSFPTAEKALEWVRISICDYFQIEKSSESWKTILKNSKIWTQTHGAREVLQFSLSRRWESLDSGMKDVMRLLYEGRTNRDIAQKLSLSSRTVENRRAKLLEIFGVDSFASLIRVATKFMEGDALPKELLK